MELDHHRAASIAGLREERTEEVGERADAFRAHLTSLSQREAVASSPAAKNPFVLKKLTQKHKDMAVLSLQGLSREKVGEYCGCTPEYVTMICKQPLVRAFIADIEAHLDLKLRGLYDKSIDAINAGLTSPKVSDKLAAAQLQLGTIGKLKAAPSDSNQTAEDVVAAMLIQGNNVQVNIKK